MTAKWLRVVGLTGVALFLLTAFTPLVNLLRYWMAPHRPVEAAQAIVVMARGGVGGDGALTDASLRGVVEALSLYRSGLAPTLIPSGAGGAVGESEAAGRKRFALGCGVPAAAIVTVEKGHTTREEASEIGVILRSRGLQKILLVVDDQGAARATAVFERQGFAVVPVPGAGRLDLGGGPEDRLGAMRLVLIELLARTYYRLAGYV
ncbi:MAG TPA: YdcF family protein [Methylomirabilota bacterium]|nr:YdcF family protein [Methylomirabilota bacterium]